MYSCSGTKLYLTLCDPMTCSTSGFSVLHYLSEFAQTHVHWVQVMSSNHIVLCLPCLLRFQSFPASGSFPRSWIFTQVAKVFEFQLQHQSFQWIFKVDSLYDWLVWSPCGPRDSQESSPTTQFKASNLRCSVFFIVQLISIHDYWKNHSYD